MNRICILNQINNHIKMSTYAEQILQKAKETNCTQVVDEIIKRFYNHPPTNFIQTPIEYDHTGQIICTLFVLSILALFLHKNNSKIRSTSFIDFVFNKGIMNILYSIFLLPMMCILLLHRFIFFCAGKISFSEIYSGINYTIEKDMDYHQLIYIGTLPLSNEEHEHLNREE